MYLHVTAKNEANQLSCVCLMPGVHLPLRLFCDTLVSLGEIAFRELVSPAGQGAVVCVEERQWEQAVAHHDCHYLEKGLCVFSVNNNYTF